MSRSVRFQALRDMHLSGFRLPLKPLHPVLAMIGQPYSNPVFIIGQRNFVCSFQRFRNSVCHRNTFSAQSQHFNVVPVITEGGRILQADTACLRQRPDCFNFPGTGRQERVSLFTPVALQPAAGLCRNLSCNTLSGKLRNDLVGPDFQRAFIVAVYGFMQFLRLTDMPAVPIDCFPMRDSDFRPGNRR